MIEFLNPVFNPKSIVIIGASQTAGKLAERRIKSLIEGEYNGKIYLVNPNREKLFERKCYNSILDIEDNIDLVLLIIPSKFVHQAVRDCATKKAKAIVIMTAGFGEVNATGRKLEDKILAIAKQNNITILGPNCNGIYSSSARMNLLGVPFIKPGPLSIIAQSGNIIISLAQYARLKKVGFSKIISAGNARGIKFHDYIEFLNQDKDTHVIMLYLEEIRDGNEFIEITREVSKNKPIVALKSGRTDAGTRAAFSHTGSLTGDDQIIDAALKQSGIIRVFNVDELFDVSLALANLPPTSGKNMAILSEGGGDSSIAADNAERLGFNIPIFSETVQNKIRRFVLNQAASHNPVDYGASAEENPEDISKIVKLLMQENNVDIFYITGFFGGFSQIIAPHIGDLEVKTSLELGRLMQKYQKPIVVHSSFADEPVRSMEVLKETGIFTTTSSERAARCLASLTNFNIRKMQLRTAKFVKPKEFDLNKAKKLIQDVEYTNNRKIFLEPEVKELLNLYGIHTPNEKLVKTPKEAINFVKSIGYPVALKIVSSDIIHKSDIGGVVLNLTKEYEINDAFITIIERARNYVSASQISGILVSPMMPKGVECIIGMKRSPQFGPVIMFGLGGIFVEILKDVSFRVAPLTDLDVNEMVSEINGISLLQGSKGSSPKDINAIKDIIIKISQLALNHPEIVEIDLNPVIVHENSYSIVDARILLI